MPTHGVHQNYRFHTQISDTSTTAQTCRAHFADTRALGSPHSGLCGRGDGLTPTCRRQRGPHTRPKEIRRAPPPSSSALPAAIAADMRLLVGCGAPACSRPPAYAAAFAILAS